MLEARVKKDVMEMVDMQNALSERYLAMADHRRRIAYYENPRTPVQGLSPRGRGRLGSG